jgi:type IV secretion system protein VirB10
VRLLERLRGREKLQEGSDAGEGESGTDAQYEGHVAGERGESAVQRPPPLQSRVTNILVMGFLGTAALGLLGWYYAQSLGSENRARTAAQSSAQDKAKGEMALPPLGRVDPPPPGLRNLLGPPPDEPPAEILEAWRRPAKAPPVGHLPAAGPAGKSPAQLRLERRLAGPAFAGPGRGGAAAAGAPAGVGPASGGDLAALLQPTVTEAASARVLPTQQLLLPKGAFLDCTLETAIDSSLSGMTTCVLATDSFGADGSVVLLERGTKLVGETRGQVRAGSARIFVLWTEARTPKGVVVPLVSPGTDELGRAGLPGKVNRHFFERFGAAILVSVIDGAVQAGIQSQREEGDTLIVNPSISSQVMTEVLKSTISIPPTVVKPQGDRIQVLVARDLDFRSVYELKPVAIARE